MAKRNGALIYANFVGPILVVVYPSCFQCLKYGGFAYLFHEEVVPSQNLDLALHKNDVVFPLEKILPPQDATGNQADGGNRASAYFLGFGSGSVQRPFGIRSGFVRDPFGVRSGFVRSPNGKN